MHGDISYGMKVSHKMIDFTKVESKVHIFENHLGVKFKTQAIKIFHNIFSSGTVLHSKVLSVVQTPKKV